MTQRTKPPFRADHVGSILRTAPVKQARAKHEKKQITDAQLKEIEDREIVKIIQKQEEVGLKAITDGEFRRSWWHFDFYGMMDNVEIYELDHGIQFQGVQTKPRSIKVTERSGFLVQSSDDRTLQVSQGEHQADAEDVHPGAVDLPFPA